MENAHQAGGGGEYEVQVGFGWTNGVVLDLLRRYGDRLTLNHTAHTWLDQGSAAACRQPFVPISFHMTCFAVLILELLK